ncbi:FeoC-like transcriptional regulator [uncultured Methanolobus sp.]|uniref:FeoC-like transcriptional regulator n=1 Tax=uncultured Methanolobus sp. TaxID=218300 RepID=UPI0029C8B37D|nr:FeoC-like transcriptional regulator [uncultured Methanolobus sp.]
MVVGYNFLLRRVAAILDSKENLTTSTFASNLNLRQDEFRDILNIMIKKGDVECTVEGQVECGVNCSGCSKICAGAELINGRNSMKSYKLTEKGRAIYESLS